MKSGKVFLGVLAGLAAGAVLGILFAPEKGSKTRRKIVGGAKDLAQDLTDKIKNKARSLQHKAAALESMAEDRITDMSKTIKQGSDGFKTNN